MACTICVHPERDAIDRAIVAAVPQRAIARQWCVSRDAVQRHAKRHLSEAWAAMQTAEQAERRATLLDRVEGLIERAEAMFTTAAAEGKVSQALDVLKELRLQLTLLGQATGELDTRPVTVVNLQTAPEWLAMRAVILSALMAYPEARSCVSGRLLELEAGS